MNRWSSAAFERHIHRQAAESAAIRFTTHARTRMAQRGIILAMVLDCLRKGVIRRVPERNLKTGWYECRMERYTGGKHVAVIAAVDEADPAVIVVTVIDLDT